MPLLIADNSRSDIALAACLVPNSGISPSFHKRLSENEKMKEGES
jgi:hypothetical protein